MSEILPIKVKWLKSKFDVNVMLDEPVEVLKAQVGLSAYLLKSALRILMARAKDEINLD